MKKNPEIPQTDTWWTIALSSSLCYKLNHDLRKCDSMRQWCQNATKLLSAKKLPSILMWFMFEHIIIEL